MILRMNFRENSESRNKFDILALLIHYMSNWLKTLSGEKKIQFIFSNRLLKKILIRRIMINKTNWTWLRKGNLNKRYYSLLITEENNAIKTKYVIAKIVQMQQNCYWRLGGDRDETINHIISKCIKLAQKEYKARHNKIGKVNHRGMCKKFKFDQMY